MPPLRTPKAKGPKAAIGVEAVHVWLVKPRVRHYLLHQHTRASALRYTTGDCFFSI